MKFSLARQWRTATCVLGAGALVMTTVVATLALSPGVASAARRPLCVGTAASPGVLAGNYRSGVRIEGVCTVNGGPAIVHGKMTISANSALIAAFGLNDLTGKGGSKLTVYGTVVVKGGATLILGCDATSFPCADDPTPTAPTLSSADLIRGSLNEQNPLGVVVHDATIYGDVHESGGGGGTTCAVPTTGVFAELGSPVYSDYENTTIHGDLTVTGVHSCWMGVIREGVSGSVTVNQNKLADPDAIEILSNMIAGDLSCSGNSMTWDSSDETSNLYPRSPEPNDVSGTRSGQCVVASPPTQGGPPGTGPF
jgi:hypothetical protein